MTHCSSRNSISLVILAAGLGSRFGGDKPLAPIGSSGKPLMYFSVMDAFGAGIRNLVLVVSRSIEEAMEKHFLPLLPGDLEVTLVTQRVDDLPAGCQAGSREKPWGTSHALWCARNAVPAGSIVINADDYYGPAAMNRLLAHFDQRDDWAMVSYRLENTLSESGAVNRGLCEVSDGVLVAVRECLAIESVDGLIRGEIGGKPVSLSPDAQISMNIWGFGPDIFACLEKGITRFFAETGEIGEAEYYLPLQVMASIESGENRVCVYQSTEKWLGITFREDLERLDESRLNPVPDAVGESLEKHRG
jgi:NDP-sugar pyrophosphorylase family protein